MAQAEPPPPAVRHLNQLACAPGEVAKFDGANWVCAEDVDTDTNAATECEDGEVLLGDGSCTDASVLIPPTDPFVDNGDGTITDTQTGLMWQQQLADSDPACTDADQANRDVRCVNNTYTWTDGADGDNTNPDGTAFTVFLATLNQEVTADPDSTCFAGHCDWRMPRLSELRSILLEQYPCGTTPCIADIFGPTAALEYWSSTSFGFAPGGAWYVFFSNGAVNDGGKNSGRHVRAVRGGR